MHRPHDHVPGLRRPHAGRHGLGIAHLPDEHHVRVLPHQVRQGILEVGHVDPDLSLRDDGLVVLEQVLDGVLDGHDMAGSRSGDVVEHGGDGRGLAAARGADDEHQALAGLRDLLHDRRQVQALERRHVGADPPAHEADHAPLAEHVDAKAVLPADLMGEVQRPIALKNSFWAGRHDLEDQLLHPLGGQDLAGGVLQLPEDPQLGRLADLQVNVVGLRLDGGPEVLVQLRLFVRHLMRIERMFQAHTPADSICKTCLVDHGRGRFQTRPYIRGLQPAKPSRKRDRTLRTPSATDVSQRTTTTQRAA